MVMNPVSWTKPGYTRRMKLGFGQGTRSMTLRWNHSIGRDWACWLTRIGLRRVSIGPPMSVGEAGRQGSPCAAISAAAASAWTEGWPTATTWVSLPMKRISSIRCSSRSKAPNASGMSRASRQSVR
jgi:hypothetical protein